MTVVTLKHSDLGKHQASILNQLQTFWKEGQLCDVMLKSSDGKEHQAHTAVLCAASLDLKNMLFGPFREAGKVQQRQPVEIAASGAVVLALLEYIYGGYPQVKLEESLELWRLADAYNLPDLAAAIEAGLRVSLQDAPVAAALQVLQQTQDLRLHELKALCEDKVAANFESSIELVEFINLNDWQLARILRREDLQVSREEVVLRGLFNWLKISDRSRFMGVMLQHVDLQSLSSSNLALVEGFSASMGSAGHALQNEVGEALHARRKRGAGEAIEGFRPKRYCLRHWSPDLGASAAGPRRVVVATVSMCWHEDTMYFARDGSIFSWKPGGDSRALAGKGAHVNGVNDLGKHHCLVAVSPEGEIFVADLLNDRLLSFKNGCGRLVCKLVEEVRSMVCSPSGVLYFVFAEAVENVLEGARVEKLVGTALETVMCSSDLPDHLRFSALNVFVTKEEVVYIDDEYGDRIWRISPGEATPVVVAEGHFPGQDSARVNGFCVTEDGQIFISAFQHKKVYSFRPGDPTWTEIVACPDELHPGQVLMNGNALYVIMDYLDLVDEEDASGVYEVALPHDLILDVAMEKGKGMEIGPAAIDCCVLLPSAARCDVIRDCHLHLTMPQLFLHFHVCFVPNLETWGSKMPA